MDLPVAILITLGASALTALVFALAHRRAKGPLLADSGRGRPMIQVAGTGFAVLLAFVILAAFQTYNGARTGAASEAQALLDMDRTADLFPAAQRDRLRGALTCYARAVVHQEWPAMRNGASSPIVDGWIASYRALFSRLDLHTTREQLSFQELLNLAATRTAGRQQRLSADTPAIPTPLWVALIFGGCVTVLLEMSMLDPRERVHIHAPMVAAVAGIVAAGLLVVYFLDHPYQPDVGGLQPTAMRQTLTSLATIQPDLRLPCDAGGRPI